MGNKKIAISSFWPLPAELLERIKNAAPGYELLDLGSNPTDAQLTECEIMFGSVVKPEQINKMINLKWAHAQTAGVESYLNPEAKLPENLVLTNSSGAFGVAIAEYMLTVTLMLLRNARGYITNQQQELWQPLGNALNIYGSRVAVIGMGDIGGRYAQICHALGASVCGVVRSPRAEKPSYVDELLTTEQIDEAIKNADVVALALPGTGETAGVLSRQRLLAMKKGAVIVNVGRGSAIDQDALIELLQNGHLGGAGLDVTTPEPLPKGNPLWLLPNVVLTPHTSHGGRDNTSELIIGKFLRYLKDYLNGNPFERVVDKGAGY